MQPPTSPKESIWDNILCIVIIIFPMLYIVINDIELK